MSITYLDNDDIAKLEKTAKYARDRLLVRLLFRLGCRISEVLGISVSDIDFDMGTITIQHLKTRINLSCSECHTRISKMAKFCPGCGAKIEKTISREGKHHRQRILPVDIETLVILREYIDRGGPLSRGDKKILFGITRRHAWRIVTKIASDAGFGHLVTRNDESCNLRALTNTQRRSILMSPIWNDFNLTTF